MKLLMNLHVIHHLNRSKRLYKKLEDIWNYRTFLSYEVKSSISPPHGIIFNIPINEIYNKTDVLEIQDDVEDDDDSDDSEDESDE